jgi:hypothetical protein
LNAGTALFNWRTVFTVADEASESKSQTKSSTVDVAEPLRQLVRKARAECDLVDQREAEPRADAHASLIHGRRTDRKYSAQELASSLWSLVHESESERQAAWEEEGYTSGDEAEDVAENRPTEQSSMQHELGQTQRDVQMAQLRRERERRPACFEDIGVPQQTAWYAPTTFAA